MSDELTNNFYDALESIFEIYRCSYMAIGTVEPLYSDVSVDEYICYEWHLMWRYI